MREIGTIYEFDNGMYELIEDHIVSKKKKKKVIIWLNLSTFLMLGLGIVFSLLVTSDSLSIVIDKPIDLILFIVVIIGVAISFLLYAILHEWLHGYAFRVFNKNTKEQIKFGIAWKSAMAFCISTIPVKVNAGRLSLMMPVYVVCIPLYILAMLMNNIWIALIASYYLSGSVGDFYYMWKLRKTSKELYMHEEMPTGTGYEVGYLLLRKIEGTF